MFRKMIAVKKAISREDCIALLKAAPRGVLSVIGDEGWPYGMPMNYWYCEEDGKIYFHSAKRGHRTDALRADDRASFCVMDEGRILEGDWAPTVRSVIAFGRIEFVEDQARAIDLVRQLSYKYTRDEAFIEEEIRRFASGFRLFAMSIEHLTGKQVKES